MKKIVFIIAVVTLAQLGAVSVSYASCGPYGCDDYGYGYNPYNSGYYGYNNNYYGNASYNYPSYGYNNHYRPDPYRSGYGNYYGNYNCCCNDGGSYYSGYYPAGYGYNGWYY